MKNAALKRDLMKEVTIALICILMAIGNMAFASGKDTLATTKGNKNKSASANVKNTKKVLSAEEAKFYQDIEDFYQENYVKSTSEEILPKFNFHRIVVYGQDGSVVQEQNNQLDLNRIPSGANKLFVENGVAYYYIF